MAGLRTRRFAGVGVIFSVVGASAAMLLDSEAHAQDCTSPDPAQWPPSAKPYFMLVVDTSGSMNCCTTPAAAGCAQGANPVWECNAASPGYALNSCGMVPSRLNDAKCALRKTVQAFGGQVNLGMATYARTLSNCGNGSCRSGNFAESDCGTANGSTCNPENYTCTVSNFTDNSGDTGCGNFPGCSTNGLELTSPPNFAENTWRNSANIVVPLLQDPASWTTPGTPPATNVATLLQWFDESCTNNRELFADGATPIAGPLRGVAQYLRSGLDTWSASDYCTNNAFTHTTPLGPLDRDCRDLNVLLVTDGDETCDNQAAAVAAATDLFQNGVTMGGVQTSVRVHVINFAGGSTANTNQIAAAGGTTASISATNETTLALALSNIISSTIEPEVCNNDDDNCNGCVDEGYVHYCNDQQTCCSWGNDLQREACLTSYVASLNTSPPNGDLTLLPCTTPAQSSDPDTWLCYDPGDECDDVDNNCSTVVDEGSNKCGNPPHCPLPETCNGQDDNCDGVVDDGGVCGACVPSAEICDGCDNDCDGLTDDGVAPVACGFSPPANCAGFLTCGAPQVVTPGGCVPGGFGACSNSPGTETCDGQDNDCDGIIDDGVAAIQCVPVGTDPTLVYGGTSQCVRGTQPCGGQCTGFIGPSTEICDGIDNDCDNQVDEGVLPGENLQCGTNFAPCTPGLTECQNGAMVCVGGNQPDPEVCDGVDNDCDGLSDEAPLADAPAAPGCWNIPGNGCGHDNLTWNPPPGGGCTSTDPDGAGPLPPLSAPCNTGTLVCAGAQQWVCQGGVIPATEVCDGVDNDCDGTPDDGSFPGEGATCGVDAPTGPGSTPPLDAGCNPGPCETGVIDCQGGFLDCVGDVGPDAELCDNIDNNCNGLCNDGIVIGGDCTPAYDTALYPGARDNPPCQPGSYQCDVNGGLVCVGGVGPSPEVCDGVDNDCDGDIDETGNAPDGINGSDNPFPPPDASIGEVCGVDEGACEQGAYACVGGVFTCLGGTGPQVEVCDCSDNDCDGTPDNPNPGNMPPLCGEGKDCVEADGSCQCAAPCSSGEFECPAGQVCTEVTSSETGEMLGEYCLTDACNDCEDATNLDTDGNVLCAPAGTQGDDCSAIPVCECKGQNGCQPPCFGVTCDSPLVCAPSGADAGDCVVDNCFNLGCGNCDEACNDLGDCVTNPCTADTCRPDETCKPSEDFSTFTCTPSCANLDCDAGEVCKDGVCVATCDPECASGTVCDLSQDPPTCVPDQCAVDACPNGGCCDPIDGSCGNCPCDGVVCPDDQVCQDGECATGMGGEGGGGQGGGGQGGGPGQGGGGQGQGASGEGGSTSSAGDDGVWGLATGGGGCACTTTGARDDRSTLGLLCAALGLAAASRRRSKKGQRGEGVSR
ncbi:MAG: hypothetical protein IPG04_06900 [Polyangiaceae bacterium]|nr:hypothetical protein [Polyangiaceae bacterium]